MLSNKQIDTLPPSHTPTKALDTLRFLNSATGEELGAASIDYFYRLARSKLRLLLSSGIGIQYDKKLKDLTYSDDDLTVTAHFEDGTSRTGRLIIGADGAKSTVRKLAMSNESTNTPTPNALPRRLPFAATWASSRFTNEQAQFLSSFHPLYLAGVHPHGRFSFFGMQDRSLPSDPSSWLFFFYISYSCPLSTQAEIASWSQAQLLEHVRDMARELSDPWKSAFEWLPDDHPLWFTGMTDWDPSVPENAWDSRKGRMTLVGDAAHVMTYQRGQGLNHSMADAKGVVEAITKFWRGEERQADVIEEFEREMKKRAGVEVKMGTANTEMLHEWAKAMQSPLFSKGLNKS